MWISYIIKAEFVEMIKISAFNLLIFFLICWLISLCVNKYIVDTEEQINVDVCLFVQVRFSALVMLLELANKLRENYMVLLPETIPFLAELMEGKNIKQMGTHIFVNKVHHFT